MTELLEPPAKELALTIRVRNNLLKSRRERLGFTPRQIAEASGISYPRYLALESLKARPRAFEYQCRIPACDGRATGATQFLCFAHVNEPRAKDFPVKTKWSTPALKLAQFHGCTPEELFPEAVQRITNPAIEREVDVSDLEAVVSLTRSSLSQEAAEVASLGPEVHVGQQQLSEAIRREVDNLPLRDQRIVRARFGLDGKEPMTLEQLASDAGASVEIVRRIEQRAIRRLRRPHARRRLEAVLPEGDE